MSSSSSVDAVADVDVQAAFARFPFCNCKRKPVLDISNTEANPQRRFLRCPLKLAFQCGFFKWVDPWRPPTQAEDVNPWISMATRMNQHCEFLEENARELRIEMCELRSDKEKLMVDMEELTVELEHMKSANEILIAEKDELKSKLLMMKVVMACVVLLVIPIILA